MNVKITYLINQYPKVSHSFIRREIIALEEQGITIHRVAIRGWDADIADKLDEVERSKTSYLLLGGVKSILISGFRAFIKKPFLFISALKKVFLFSSGSEKNFFYHLIYLLEACKLVELCKQQNSNHIHAHFGTNSSELAYFAHALGGIDFSFTVHGPEEFDKPVTLHLSEKLTRAKFVAAISNFTRSQLFRWVEYKDWNKIHVVHCGLDRSFFAETESNIAVSTEYRNLLCIGRLCEQKGQLLLVEAIKRVIEKGINVHLTLAGDGEMRTEVEALIKRYNLNDFVMITGWISSDEVKVLLHKADAMVLPSFAEGLPVAIMEAMACRTPVLSTYIAGIPELVQNSVNGWLFPAGSIDQIVTTIEEFMSTSEEQLEAICESAYRSVLEHHSIDTEAAKLVNLFRQ